MEQEIQHVRQISFAILKLDNLNAHIKSHGPFRLHKRMQITFFLFLLALI